MYVCVCNGYRDEEISAAAQSGLRCARAVYDTLGAAPRCGRCLSFAQSLVDDVHGEPSGEPSGEPAGEPALLAQAG